MLGIHRGSKGNSYCIQSFANLRVNGIWNPVTDASYTLPLINATYKMNVSLYPEMNMILNFTIGIGTEAIEKYIKYFVSC